MNVRAADRKIDALHRSHDCDPLNWSARVQSPGFSPNAAGMSIWTCDTCRPLVVEIFDAELGGHEVIDGPPRSLVMPS